jgi:hypothetical protein
MMAEDYYQDGNSSEPTTKEASADPSQESESKTALLPKDICPDMQPGDEMMLKVVRVHDDQYEVEYSAEPSEKEVASSDPEPTAPTGDNSMYE